MEDQIRHTAVTSQNGRLKARSESQEKHRIALDGEDWYDVRHGRLIINPDGTAEEEEQWLPWKQVILSKLLNDASLASHGFLMWKVLECMICKKTIVGTLVQGCPPPLPD